MAAASFARPQNPLLQVFDQTHLAEELDPNQGKVYSSQTLIHYVVSNNGVLELYNLRDGDLEALPTFAEETVGPSSELRLKAFFLTLAPGSDHAIQLSATSSAIDQLRTRFGLWDILLYNYVSASWSNLQDFCTCYQNGANETVFEFLFRFRYSPHVTERIGVSFCQALYNLSQNTLTYFFTNVPQTEVMSLISGINSHTSQPIPFLLESLILQRALKSWETSLFHARNLYFQREMDTLSSATEVNVDLVTRDLHASRQSFNDISGAFADFEEKTSFLTQTYTRFARQCLSIDPLTPNAPRLAPPAWDRDSMQPVSDSLTSLLSQAKTQRRQTKIYERRAESSTSLMAQLVLLRESAVRERIGVLTAKIEESSRRDPISLITIAALLMFFLPSILVASLFSMNFFQGSISSEGGNGRAGTRGEWKVVGDWWVVIAVAVPLTVVVAVVWGLWRKVRKQKVWTRLQVIEKMGGKVE